MNVVFFGSSKYSVIDEHALFEAFGISLVVTTLDQQDKKTKQVTPNPVKQFALEHDIPVITTDKITDQQINEIRRYQPDFIVTADIRLILPKQLLELPKKAAINVHHSLLPKFRGPAPVPYAILSGETTTGVSIIVITGKVDAGDILAQETYEIRVEDTTDSILTKLNQLGGQLVVKVIENFDEYYKNRKTQDESQATYSHYISRNDGYIDLNDQGPMINDQQLNRKILAYFPWPGVWTLLRLKATEGQAQREVRVKFLPGKMIQPEGKKPMSYKDFMNGYPEGKEILEKLHLI